MTDRTITIEKRREIGGDYFKLIYSRKRKNLYNLDYFLTFDPNDYWIYKSSGKQKEVTYEEMLEFKYSRYIFFKKELYDKEDINKWIDFVGKFGGMMYLDKPLPPIELMNKIKIKK